MPRPSKGARLYQRKDGIYVIRDGRSERRTGTRDIREAEGALKRYLIERDRPRGTALPETFTVDRTLAIYGEEHALEVVDSERIGHAIDALAEF